MPSIVPAPFRVVLPGLLLLLLTALLYGHTLHVPWYLDDYEVIIDNPLVTAPGRTAAALLAPRGVAIFSFALNHRLAGLDLTGFHLVNIAIHLACGGLILLLLRRIFRDEPFWPLCGALLFIAHPLQTQAVTYVVQRMTSLSALFFLFALYLFVRTREALASGASFRSPRHLACYFGSLAAGLLALGAKENAAVLPLALILFVLSFLPAERAWRPLLASVAPFCLAPLILASVRLLLPLSQGVGISQLTGTVFLENLSGSTPLHYLFTEFSVHWIYLRLLLLPYGQAFEHGYPVVRELLNAQNIVAGLGLLALGGLGWRLRSSRPRLTFGIAWFFLTLAVESSVIPLDPLFEHRLYLPLFGVLVVLLDLATLIPRRQLAQGLLLLVLAACALLTWQRNALWNDEVALYEDNLRHAPPNERTLLNLSSAYLAAGQWAKAEGPARLALELNPQCAYSYRNLAEIALARRQPDAALRFIETGFRSARLSASPELYVLLGRARLQQGRPDLALEPLQNALSLRREASTCNDLGGVYKALGRWSEAEQSYREALSLGGDELLFHANLARLRRQQGRRQEALAEYAAALLLAPQRSDLRFEAQQLTGPPAAAR